MVVIAAFAAGIFVVPVALPQNFTGTVASGVYGVLFLLVPWLTIWLVFSGVVTVFRSAAGVASAARVSWLVYGALGTGLGLLLGWIARSTWGPLAI
jgi:hypothetical protein